MSAFLTGECLRVNGAVKANNLLQLTVKKCIQTDRTVDMTDAIAWSEVLSAAPANHFAL